jgi:hypothetical protein
MFLYCQCVSFYRLFLYCLIRLIFSAISCHVRVDIIKGAVSTASGNATAGNSTIQAIKGLATAQVGIDKNMTGNELQQAMDLIVCMPTTMKQMSKAQHNMTGSMKDGMMMK